MDSTSNQQSTESTIGEQNPVGLSTSLGALEASPQAQLCISRLVESGRLADEDFLNLALTNKTVFRIVAVEHARFNIKTVSFTDEHSLIYRAIQHDQSDWLEYFLTLGDFQFDYESPNGRLIHDGGDRRGTHVLMSLCLAANAVNCLDVLIGYGRSITRYDRGWLVKKAKLVASETYNFHCLTKLLSVQGSLQPFWGYLLTQAWHTDHIEKLATLLPSDTDYFPYLMLECAKHNSSPFVLLELMKKVSAERLSDEEWYESCLTTPIAQLACRHNGIGLKLMLDSGVKAFERYVENPSGRRLSNPLFLALSHPFPREPKMGRYHHYSFQNQSSGRVGEPLRPDQSRLAWQNAYDKWDKEVKESSSNMRSAVELLTRHAKAELQVHLRGHVDMLQAACDIFVANIHDFLLNTVGWLLTQESHKQVLKEWAHTWQDDLSGSRLRKILSENGFTLNEDLLAVWEIINVSNIGGHVPKPTEQARGGVTGRDTFGMVDFLFNLAVNNKQVTLGEDQSRKPANGSDISLKYSFRDIKLELEAIRLELSHREEGIGSNTA
ncbi:hypothetical protein QBC35DRAFT_539502 [Podospora australis]|uniref:Uncharacterized protein n=1 Tax=Podospora australis TaxID=1536484 RepID=A0AAN6WMQ9_9PEZI|nr:hypothetical protein QBC35DRAFT_539502 [Podospora australis]